MNQYKKNGILIILSKKRYQKSISTVVTEEYFNGRNRKGTGKEIA